MSLLFNKHKITLLTRIVKQLYSRVYRNKTSCMHNAFLKYAKTTWDNKNKMKTIFMRQDKKKENGFSKIGIPMYTLEFIKNSLHSFKVISIVYLTLCPSVSGMSGCGERPPSRSAELCPGFVPHFWR